MIHPKLLASQELALHHVTVQQPDFPSHFVSSSDGLPTPGSSGVLGVSSAPFPRAPSTRSELTSPLCSGLPGGAGGSASSFAARTAPTGALLGAISGGGANSTAPASIARPAIRPRPEWAAALEDADAFALPPSQLRASTPDTRRRVFVWHVADRHDRQWLAQRDARLGPAARSAKGRAGTTEAPAPPSQRHGITRAVLERLITAFEVGAHGSPEIPVQRQPVSSFASVRAVGADPAVVEEVRRYWLGKRQALGGQLPCIPALRVAVREENQSALCHADVLQYCPLPFNVRDWSVAVLQRRAPNRGVPGGHDATPREAHGGEEQEDAGGEGGAECRKRQREAEEFERRIILSSAAAVAAAVLEREGLKLRHTQLALYELALLRRSALAEREMGDGSNSNNNNGTSTSAGPWATEDALQEEWDLSEGEGEGEDAVMDVHKGAAAAESVIGIGEHF